MDRCPAKFADVLLTGEKVLVLLAELEQRLEGLGVLQKLTYICDLTVGAPLDHVPTPYGPVSSCLDDSLARLVGTGLVRECRSGTARWGAYWSAYRYELTVRGDLVGERIMRDHPQPAAAIGEALGIVRGIVPDLDERVLAGATSLHLSLRTAPHRIPDETGPVELIKRSAVRGVAENANVAARLLDELWLLGTRELEPVIAA